MRCSKTARPAAAVAANESRKSDRLGKAIYSDNIVATPTAQVRQLIDCFGRKRSETVHRNRSSADAIPNYVRHCLLTGGAS